MANNGGARPGAGRPKGSPNRATIARQQEIAASGETPLAYLIRIMRDPNADQARRDECAKAAAPYVHPRLAAIEHGGSISLTLEQALVEIDSETLAAIDSGGEEYPFALAYGLPALRLPMPENQDEVGRDPPTHPQ